MKTYEEFMAMEETKNLINEMADECYYTDYNRTLEMSNRLEELIETLCDLYTEETGDEGFVDIWWVDAGKVCYGKNISYIIDIITETSAEEQKEEEAMRTMEIKVKDGVMDSIEFKEELIALVKEHGTERAHKVANRLWGEGLMKESIVVLITAMEIEEGLHG